MSKYKYYVETGSENYRDGHDPDILFVDEQKFTSKQSALAWIHQQRFGIFPGDGDNEPTCWGYWILWSLDADGNQSEILMEGGPSRAELEKYETILNLEGRLYDALRHVPKVIA